MATGHDLSNSVESQQIKLEYKLSEVYFMFKEFIECSNDGKVKWLSNLNDLKAFMGKLKLCPPLGNKIEIMPPLII